MTQKIKRESWLVFYRTKSGKLTSKEVEIIHNINFKDDPEPLVTFCMSKEDAMAIAEHDPAFDHFEIGPSGPIVKRLQYV